MQDLTGKITGSTLTAAEWNQLPEEVQNVIVALGITLSSGDTNQLGKAIAGYVANGNFYTDSGVADAYVLSTIGSKQSLTEYTDGSSFEFVAGSSNAGASTVNVSGLGVKNIKLSGGGDPAPGDISGRVALRFDSGNDWCELIKPTLDAAPVKNSLINSRFRVNQRGVTGSVVLSAGEYGHDRFRAGSSGCTYTFSTSGGVTTLTISAGTLEQEILADNIQAGDNVLSWTGTSQGQIDGGGFGTSGNVTANLTGSANTTCEWSTGTLTQCQLELGASSTPLEFKLLQEDIDECHYYAWKPAGTVTFMIGARKADSISPGSITDASFSVSLLIPHMRVTPTIEGVTAANVTLHSESGGLQATCNAVPTVKGVGRNILDCSFASADVTDVTQMRFAVDIPFFSAEL